MPSDGLYPMSELFGPTRQGEGPQAGLQTYFFRFAGCDWDCDWCDTKYAVLPQYPGWKRTMMSAEDIAEKLHALGAEEGDWITLSGGNPALFVDDNFTNVLHAQHGFKLAMETQGSRDISMASNEAIDCMVVSPKPPSSKMHKRYAWRPIIELMSYRSSKQTSAIKFVAFDDIDLDWIYLKYIELKDKLHGKEIQWFLSVGTPLQMPYVPNVEDPIERVRLVVCENLADLWLRTLSDERKRFGEFKILPQLHTLVWGQKEGV